METLVKEQRPASAARRDDGVAPRGFVPAEAIIVGGIAPAQDRLVALSSVIAVAALGAAAWAPIVAIWAALG